MSTCPRCGAENFINTCENCGFEQTRDVLSYYTLSKLNEDDVSFFSSKERITKQCAKKLRLLNRLIRESEKDEADGELIALCEEYIRIAALKSGDKSQGNSAEELYQLGQEYYSGKETGEPNYAKAFELFSRASEKGNADAMYYLGNMYRCGNGVAVDYYCAMEWYQKAADKGNIQSMYEIGDMYYWGCGVARNCYRAMDYFLAAAEKGNPAAMCDIGIMYNYGQGVPRDYARAFEWYKKAAENGNADAMDNLAKMYKKGQGVARDKQKAKDWKRKAEAAKR